MLSLLISIIIDLAIVGLVLWAIEQFPLDPTMAKLIRVVVVVFAVIYLLYLLQGHVGGHRLALH